MTDIGSRKDLTAFVVSFSRTCVKGARAVEHRARAREDRYQHGCGARDVSRKYTADCVRAGGLACGAGPLFDANVWRDGQQTAGSGLAATSVRDRQSPRA